MTEYMPYLFVAHGLCAFALLGAVTHQVLSVWWPVRGGNPNFMARFRAVKAANYVNAIIVLYILTFTFGSIVYPAYRIGARVYMENLKMSAVVGSFEMKEHLVTFGLGLLAPYWFYWRQPMQPGHELTRKMLVLLLALFVWTAFLTGYVLNNIRGV